MDESIKKRARTEKDVHVACRAFEKISPGIPERISRRLTEYEDQKTSISSCPTLTPTRNFAPGAGVTISPSFGKKHPDIRKPSGHNVHIQWSDDEKSYLIKAVQEVGRFRRAADCLARIRAAPDEVKEIFHPHHLQNSARLRPGVDNAVKVLKSRGVKGFEFG